MRDANTSMPTSTPRVLAIAPGAQFLGVAVLEGEELVSFGVKSFTGRKTVEILIPQVERYLDKLVAEHAPDMLVVEDVFYAQARLSPFLQPLIAALKRRGRRRGLRVKGYLPTTVKARLCTGKQTRKGLAEAMVGRYWFLCHYARAGRTWRYWQQMFDAVGLAVVAVMDAMAMPKKVGRVQQASLRRA